MYLFRIIAPRLSLQIFILLISCYYRIVHNSGSINRHYKIFLTRTIIYCSVILSKYDIKYEDNVALLKKMILLSDLLDDFINFCLHN